MLIMMMEVVVVVVMMTLVLVTRRVEVRKRQAGTTCGASSQQIRPKIISS